MNKRALLNAVIGLTKRAQQDKSLGQDYQLDYAGKIRKAYQEAQRARKQLPLKALKAVQDHVIKPVPPQQMPAGVQRQFIDAYQALGIKPDKRMVGDIGFAQAYLANYADKQLGKKIYDNAMKARLSAQKAHGVKRFPGTAPLVVYPHTSPGTYAAPSGAGMRIYPSKHMPSATVPALWNILWGNTGAKTMGEAGAYVRDAARFFDIKQPFAKFKAPVFVNPYMHGSVGSPLLSRYQGRAASPYNNSMNVQDAMRHQLAHNTAWPAIADYEGNRKYHPLLGNPTQAPYINDLKQLVLSQKPRRQAYMMMPAQAAGALSRAKATMVNALGVQPKTIRQGIDMMLAKGYLARQRNGRLVATRKLIKSQHFPNTDLQQILTNYDMSDRGQPRGNILEQMQVDPGAHNDQLDYIWPQANNTKRNATNGVV